VTQEPTLSVRAVELREVAIPLVRPFRTSFGEETQKRAILVRAITDDGEGWGECVSSDEPRYSEEWLEGSWMALERWMSPAVVSEVHRPDQVASALRWIRGHRMAKAALEAAVLDGWLRMAGVSLSSHLGGVRDRVPCGVSVGIAPTAEAMLEEILGYLSKGYRRVKLKIEPGRDLAVVRTIREALPDTPLSVDANGAYTPADTPLFEALDELGLMMMVQPLDTEDLLDHAALQARLRTPICLDESIRSARDALAAVRLEACRIINIKPGRVGGILEAKRVHDVAFGSNVPVWIGGMLETGVGRAANLALASMPGVTLPGDTSASDRYFREDLTEPFVLSPDGTMPVPAAPGIGVEPLPEHLRRCTVRTSHISARST